MSRLADPAEVFLIQNVLVHWFWNLSRVAGLVLFHARVSEILFKPVVHQEFGSHVICVVDQDDF